MKCELCQKADAEAAITRLVDGKEQELYVCKACAHAEKRAKQKRSQRTRKSVEISGDEPPPIIGALIDAVNGMVNDLEKMSEDEDPSPELPPKKHVRPARVHLCPLDKVPIAYRVRGALYLAGLDLIGELPAVKRALHALGMDLLGFCGDGVHEAGRVYKVSYTGSRDQARRIVGEILHQEVFARRRLLHEMPRVYADSLCRALAALKNCRLLAPTELFDLLCALRLGALDNLFEGITTSRIDRLIADCNLSGDSEELEAAECDRLDAERADETNARFENVMLNDRAEDLFK